MAVSPDPPHPASSLPRSQGAIVGIEDPSRKFFGIQYHPEVMHSLRGRETIKRFLFDICGLRGDWSMRSVLDEQLEAIRTQARGAGLGGGGWVGWCMAAVCGGVNTMARCSVLQSASMSLR